LEGQKEKKRKRKRKKTPLLHVGTSSDLVEV
jgi:hypothetical protein